MLQYRGPARSGFDAGQALGIFVGALAAGGTVVSDFS